jgi:hypothetical protein
MHADSTWGFTKFTVTEGEEDIYSTLGDGRIICLKYDNTWSFVKSRPPRKKTYKDYPAVNTTGTAVKVAIDVASQVATNEALTRVATKLKPLVKSGKNSQGFLTACIKQEVGETGTDITTAKTSAGWKADAKIALTNIQVKKICDCVDEQLSIQAEEGAAKDSTKGAASPAAVPAAAPAGK